MILGEAHTKAVSKRMAAEAIDESSDTHRKLVFVFGHHTFFMSAAGVFIVEKQPGPKKPGVTRVERVRLATWTTRDRNVLKPIKATPKARKIEVERALPG